MRDWLKRGLVLCIGMAAVMTFERWYFRESLEGIVLRVEEGERVLLAQNLNLDGFDLKRSYIEWLLGDYELIEVTNITGVESGMQVSVTFDGRTFSENAMRVAAMDYEILDVAFSAVDVSVPASSQGQAQWELAGMFPMEVGHLQVFNGRDSYAYVQRLARVMEIGDALQVYFEGHPNSSDSIDGGFHLMYHIEGDSIVEFVKNFDAEEPEQGLRLHSIIERKTILKGPLEVGNSWTNRFSFEGEFHEAVTEIVRVETNQEGRLEVETHTVLEDVEGFVDGRYEERRVFVEGSGMTEFVNSPREGDNAVFTYGFSLVTEKMD